MMVNNFINYSLLEKAARSLQKLKIADLFQEKGRYKHFSLTHAGITLDYSKNLLTGSVMNQLFGLAREVNLEECIQEMFRGKPINFTENRAVLHTALRSRDLPEVENNLERMYEFADKVRTQQWLGCTGKPIKYLVHIGIGGSHLGPEMVITALANFVSKNLEAYFISNLDGENFKEVCQKIEADQTLFIIASKSFTTQETLFNALVAKKWFLQQVGGALKAIGRHFVALSTAKDLAADFGILAENVFPFREWVGGRFSLWSSIGLVMVIMLGPENFEQLLAGARQMDEHFSREPLENNLPVILALIGIWNVNFLKRDSLAVIPYSYRLRKLVNFFQQLEMESNGKMVNKRGELVNYATCPVVWGGVGTDSQHSFHQALMQGTNRVAVDFIFPVLDNGEAQQFLFAHCLAQSRALMVGRDETIIRKEMLDLSKNEQDFLVPFKLIPGNVPNNLLLMEGLTPKTLGALIALYEHKVFVQGVIWQINSFDQWGVELGKNIAKTVIPLIQQGKEESLDPSTWGLIKQREKILGKL